MPLLQHIGSRAFKRGASRYESSRGSFARLHRRRVACETSRFQFATAIHVQAIHVHD